MSRAMEMLPQDSEVLPADRGGREPNIQMLLSIAEDETEEDREEEQKRPKNKSIPSPQKGRQEEG